MYYFFVSIQFYVNKDIHVYSTHFKSKEFLPKNKLIEKCVMKNIVGIYNLGFDKIYDIIHDGKTLIVCYSKLTKDQYDIYKKN
jgi:hypothetical protein